MDLGVHRGDGEAVAAGPPEKYELTLPDGGYLVEGDIKKFVPSIEAHGLQNQPAVLETVFHRAALAASVDTQIQPLIDTAKPAIN